MSKRTQEAKSSGRWVWVVLVGLSSLSPTPKAVDAQVVGRIVDRSDVVESRPELRDLAYARAVVAVHENDVASLRTALRGLERLPDMQIDRVIQGLSLSLPSELSEAEREDFVLSTVLPYLFPSSVGQELSCTAASTFQRVTEDQSGVRDVTAENAALNCNAGATSIFHSRVRSDDPAGELETDFEGYRLGTVPIWVTFPAPDRFVVRAEDAPSHTLLGTAAALGHVEMMDVLLSAGASPDTPSQTGRTALHDAAARGRTGAVQRLLDAGASSQATTDELLTALHEAASAGSTSSATALLRAGADVNARSGAGETPLLLALKAGHVEVAGALLDTGADPRPADVEGATPLMIAVLSAPEMVDPLLTAGSEAAATDRVGRSALHYAVDSPTPARVSVVESLARGGSELDARTDAGSTALHLALRGGHGEAAAALIRAGADVRLRDADGRRPLALSIESELDLIEALVAAGAELDEPDEDGRTALHHAVATSNVAMVRQTLRLGASVDVTTEDGSTPLMLAAESGGSDIARLLVEAGASVEARDAAGNTPLHRGAAAGSDDAAEFMLRSGAPRGARNAEGRSAEDLAAQNGHGDVRSLFRHTKLLHVAPVKVGVNLTRFEDPQHESSLGWEYSVALGIRVHSRVRLQLDWGFMTRATDPVDEDGPVVLPPGGDFYYWINTVEMRPMIRVALGNPYRTHPYLLAGAAIGSVNEIELRDWSDPDADGQPVTDTSVEEFTSAVAGLGVEWTLGRIITSLELLYSRASPIDLDLFAAQPLSTFGLALVLAW